MNKLLSRALIFTIILLGSAISVQSQSNSGGYINLNYSTRSSNITIKVTDPYGNINTYSGYPGSIHINHNSASIQISDGSGNQSNVYRVDLSLIGGTTGSDTREVLLGVNFSRGNINIYFISSGNTTPPGGGTGGGGGFIPDPNEF